MLGGGEGAISTGFIEGMDNMLLDKAGIYYEGGFMGGIATANFPDLTCGEDYTFFTFPSIKPELGKPIVLGAGFAVVFNDRPEVREFMKYMMSEEGNTLWAKAPKGKRLSVNKNVPLDLYDTCGSLEADAMANSSIAVFDGSDLATPAVGGDAMFVGLQDFVADPDAVDDILEYIEDAADNSY